ncbi:MAG: hypothetical protein K2M95_01475, partial [Clostridiales bacterium]|nr:hypothetical protein [Clostridiales bacterium]
SDTLQCLRSYGRVAFTLCAEDGKGNPLSYEFMPVTVTATGALQVEGNGHICLKGGYGGFFVRSIGAGAGRVTVTSELGAQSFTIDCVYTDWERF